MSRQRLYTTKDLQSDLRRMKKASPPPALPMNGTTEDYVHPASYDDPEMDQYATGDTSSWAEDVHPPPYRQSPPPQMPGIGMTEDPVHPGYEKKVEVPPTGPTTVAEADRMVRKAMSDPQIYSHIMKKSKLATEIATRTVDRRTASVGDMEGRILQLMDLDYGALAKFAQSMGIRTAEEEEADEDGDENSAFQKNINNRLARIDRQISRLVSRKLAADEDEADADEEIEALLSRRDLMAVNQNSPEYLQADFELMDPGMMDAEIMDDSVIFDDLEDDMGYDDMELGVPAMGVPMGSYMGEMNDMDMMDDMDMGVDPFMDDSADLLSELMAMDEEDGEAEAAEDEETDEETASVQELYRQLVAMEKRANAQTRAKKAKKAKAKKASESSKLLRLLLAMDEKEESDDDVEAADEEEADEDEDMASLFAADDDEDVEADEEEEMASRKASRRRRAFSRYAEEEADEDGDEMESSEDEEADEHEEETASKKKQARWRQIALKRAMRDLYAEEEEADEDGEAEAGDEEEADDEETASFYSFAGDEEEAGEDDDEEEASEEEEEMKKIEASLRALKKRKAALQRRLAGDEEEADEDEEGKSAYSTADMTIDPLYAGPGVQAGNGGNKNPPGRAMTPVALQGKKAKKGKKNQKFVVTGALDPMGLAPQNAGQWGHDAFGVHADPLSSLYMERLAGKGEEEVEEVEVEEETASKKKASRGRAKAASQRPQMPRKKQAAAQKRSYNAEVDELSQLWDAPPDISAILGNRGW